MLHIRFAITLQLFLFISGAMLLQAQSTYMFTNNTYVHHQRTMSSFDCHRVPTWERGARSQ
ncbi:MAG: hypothetical protein AAFO02_15575, partial [Bacteroidota bacterium]